MNQEKFGAFIKKIRKENHLTQKDLAHKYNVTYQAVSKWETGKNMPDIALIKQISEDFNVSMEELFDGEYKKDNTKKLYFIVIVIGIIVFAILMFTLFQLFKNDDFDFKVLSSNCDNFDISGTIAYNDQKSSIYITNIRYCGEEDNTNYKTIECILYETDQNIEQKISSYRYGSEESIRLEEFLQMVTLTVDNYNQICSDYSSNHLYLSINATDYDDRTTTYKIPLSLASSCVYEISS